MNPDANANEAATLLTKILTDKGLLIEAGFAAFRHFVIAPGASHAQVLEMRAAYMSGAEHLFSSIMTIMDPGTEPTENDMRRMDMIHKEIETWRDHIKQMAEL